MRKKILHITESFGGGVTTAINSYVENSQDHDHFIFATTRKEDLTGEENTGRFVKKIILPRDIKSILLLKKTIKELNPDIIHLHSTLAGALCRLHPSIDHKKIIYTPHGFAFLRNDHKFFLILYYYIEKLLAGRTAIIAGCSKDEMLVANKIKKNNCFELINICQELSSVKEIRSKTALPVIGMVGRLCPQKDYLYFTRLAIKLRGLAHFKWIGGGANEIEIYMKNSGIEITGWLNRSEVIRHIKGLDAYFHTAAWDGFPISVLEAAKLNIPIMLRHIGPFSSESLYTLRTEDEACKEIEKFINLNDEVIARSNMNTSMINMYHTKQNLQDKLNKLYSKI